MKNANQNENESVLFQDNYSTTSSEENSLHSSLLKILKDDSSAESETSQLSLVKKEKNKKYFTKLKYKSSRFIFPLIYFSSSIFFLFNLLFVNIFEIEETSKNIQAMPTTPFPSFSIIKELQPNLFTGIVLIIAISGFLNVWCFCSLLIQRFSVPELKSNKLLVHLMFILGILGNISFIFFGCSPKLLYLETNNIIHIKISLSTIILLAFLFFNLLFGTMTILVFENLQKKIAFNDNRLKRNIKTKRIVIHLTTFIMLIYISAILINFYGQAPRQHLKFSKLKSKDTKPDNSFNDEDIYYHTASNYISVIKSLLFVLPFFLFALNAVLNISYYFDISYLENVINLIVDKEFFLTNEESNLLLSSDFPV